MVNGGRGSWRDLPDATWLKWGFQEFEPLPSEESLGFTENHQVCLGSFGTLSICSFKFLELFLVSAWNSGFPDGISLCVYQCTLLLLVSTVALSASLLPSASPSFPQSPLSLFVSHTCRCTHMHYNSGSCICEIRQYCFPFCYLDPPPVPLPCPLLAGVCITFSLCAHLLTGI